MLFGQFLVQPRFGNGPVPRDGLGRDAECMGRLLDGQAAEEPQFDDLRLLRVHASEPLQRLVERHQIDRLPRIDSRPLERDHRDPAAGRLLLPRRLSRR
jgi:hypothetical protein